jgi:aspartate aminotransferase
MSNFSPVSKRIATYADSAQSFLRFYYESPYVKRAGEPNINDFAIGNPHEMPLSAFVDVLQQSSKPQNKDWFGYKTSERKSQQIVANALREWRGVDYDPDDICMTTGGFGALAVTLQTVVDPGDEVIFITPPWFFYELLIVAAEGVPVRAKIDSTTFNLDLDAIEAAITNKTRAIIINSPNNPTGKIYPPETLSKLSEILTDASKRNGRTIYLLSDEAYSRIVYDGQTFPSPTEFYPHSFLLYTYGKTLLTPGQRIGYIALPPTLPNREVFRQAILITQIAMGFAFPNALLQHGLGDLEKVSIDINHLQEKRDLMVSKLTEMGYDVHSPEGTFYLIPRSPIDDDWRFSEILAEHDILVLPGTIVELPGYFRISLTANDDMIQRALPGFAAALKEAKTLQPTP